MGKHSSTEDSRPDGYKGQHRAGDRRREDTNAEGKVVGWAVGREVGPDNYTER